MRKFFVLVFFLVLSPLIFAQILPEQYDPLGIGDVQATTSNETAEVLSSETREVATNPRGPWFICSIEIEGLVNVKKTLVTKEVKARKKSFYEMSFITEDTKALLSLGYFEDVLVDITKTDETEKYKEDSKIYPCHEITYILTEKPQIKKIELAGRDKLSKGKVYGAMTSKPKDPLDLEILNEDMKSIEKKYHEKGYISAEASYEIENLPKENKAVITVVLKEGPRVKINTVKLNGLESFEYKKIVGKTKNKPDKILKKEKLEKDKQKITHYYRNKGFYSFEISSQNLEFNEDKSEVNIIYELEEGPKTFFGQTTFAGNTVIPDDELAEEITYKEGKIYKEKKFMSFLQAVQMKYGDKGYLKATINPVHTVDEKGKLDTVVEITESDIVYVGDVDVAGFKKTERYVFMREILLKEGDIFSTSKMQRSMERIMNLRFIDDIQPEISQNPLDPDKADITFNIFEGKPGMLTMGAAYSSIDGFFGQLSVNHMNLFGRAQVLSLAWNFGARVLDYSLSWTTPWLGAHPTSLGFDVFNTKRIRPYSTSTSAYTEKRTGGRVRLGPRFKEDRYRLNFSYAYEKTEVSNVEDDFKSVIQEGKQDISTFFTEFVMDQTDYFFDPTKGFKNSVALEFAGGPLQGDVDIYKVNLSSSFYHTLFKIGEYPFVWVISNRFGYVNTHSDTTEVPVYERYFLGGPDTIRGYSSNAEVGPENGGQVYYIFNTELRFPLLRERKRNMISGAFFVDIGNAWRDIDKIDFRIGPSESQMKVAAGFGIRFNLPGFPIRLDWGYGFNHKAGEDKTQFHFTIGSPF